MMSIVIFERVSPEADMRERTARYTAPVQGSSTMATNTPSPNVVKRLLAIFLDISVILAEYFGEISRSDPLLLGLKYSFNSNIPKIAITAAIAK